MISPLLVGITGGIGSGKSTASKIFEILGIPVYYADDRGKLLMTEDQSLVASIRETFGPRSYFEDGTLNRAYLASEVFSNEERLAILNSLVHPAVAKDFEIWAKKYSQTPYLLKEAALLFEAGSYQQLDKTICVLAKRSVRIERILLRDEQRSVQEIEQIIDRQTSDGQRKKLSDFIINNDGDELLIPQVLSIHQELLNLSAERA